MKVLQGKLNGWYYDSVYNVIWGHITDQPTQRFRDKLHVHTSSLVTKPEGLKEGDTVETLNSKYLLGNKLSTSEGK